MAHKTFNAKSITIAELKAIAQELIDYGTITEYTRGICELLADVDGREGVGTEQRSKEIAIELGIDPAIANTAW